MLPLAVLGFAALAGAQPATDSYCEPFDQSARCVARRRQTEREIYRLAPIERLRARGVEVRRVFYAGNGPEHGVISVERARGAAPRLTYRPPYERGATRLTAAISEVAWRELLARSAQFERDHGSVAAGSAGGCAGGRHFTAEAADAAGAHRAEGRDCGAGSAAGRYADWVAELALAQFPGCSRLDEARDQPRLDVLGICHDRLRGDLTAAAEVSNALRSFTYPVQPATLPAAFAARATLDWMGERVTGRDAAAARWLRALGEPPGPHFNLAAVHGETADRVRVEGTLSYDGGPPELCIGNPIDAPVTMDWRRGADGRFALERVVVGRYLSRYLARRR